MWATRPWAQHGVRKHIISLCVTMIFLLGLSCSSIVICALILCSFAKTLGIAKFHWLIFDWISLTCNAFDIALQSNNFFSKIILTCSCVHATKAQSHVLMHENPCYFAHVWMIWNVSKGAVVEVKIIIYTKEIKVNQLEMIHSGGQTVKSLMGLVVTQQPT